MGGVLGSLAAYGSDWKPRSIREVDLACDGPKKGAPAAEPRGPG